MKKSSRRIGRVRVSAFSGPIYNAEKKQAIKAAIRGIKKLRCIYDPQYDCERLVNNKSIAELKQTDERNFARQQQIEALPAGCGPMGFRGIPMFCTGFFAGYTYERADDFLIRAFSSIKNTKNSEIVAQIIEGLNSVYCTGGLGRSDSLTKMIEKERELVEFKSKDMPTVYRSVFNPTSSKDRSKLIEALREEIRKPLF